MSDILERTIEQATGLSIEAVRNTTIDERRRQVEKKNNASTRFYSVFPLIGRGNVARERIISHKAVEEMFNKALSGKK